ncbi:MAG: alkaline phosphatase family protein [Anaerolineales bacterium]|nr:alkaline phosphatase family protein [Anaerolineales bacterium]
MAGCTGNFGLSAPTPIASTPPPVAASPSPTITAATAESTAAAISIPVPTVLPAPAEISPTPYPTLVTPTPPPTVAATHGPTAAATSTPAPTVLATPAEALATPPCPCDPACPCQINHVVIISIDGLRPDAIERADTPILDGLRTQGAYSPAAQAVLPSVTLVNHAAMLSGMSPAKHGIYWNSNDPDLGKIKGPTLFSAAHEAGLSTAMVVGKPKLEHLVLPGSVDNYIYAGFTDRQVVNEAIPLIQTNMPALLFIHLPDVDSAGHAIGWMSLAQLLAVSMTDSLIGEIVAALQEQDYLSQTLLIITSDHGGSGRRHGSDSPEDTTIPWLAVGPGVPAGVVLPGEITTYDTAATALSALRVPIPPEWDGRPVLEIFEPASP